MTPSGAAWLSALRQRVDFRIRREAADCLLGELELAVDGNLEHPAARADELDISQTQL